MTWFLRVNGKVLCTFLDLHTAIECSAPFIATGERVEIGRNKHKESM